jgi:CheY-like chemotaxis protein
MKNFKMEKADKAKIEFLENIRHDIQTPLSGIIGLSEIIKNQTMDSNIKEFTEDLAASTHALLDLLNKILETIKIGAGEIPMIKKKFNLQKKLNKVIVLNQPKAHQKNIALLFEHDPAIPKYFMSDPTRVHRIALELVTNALKFTQTGHVKVSTHLVKHDAKTAVITIQVEDTGIGISLEKQDSIYTQFKRLAPSYQGFYKGIGVGLSMVKQFVDDLEGELSVKSQLGVGSTLTVVLRLKKSLLDKSLGHETHTISTPSTVIPPAESAGKHAVLVVEDNVPAASAATRLFADLDCQVTLVNTGEQAIELAKKNRYDLILMDLGLPGIDGYETTLQIRSNESAELPTPIIALTAHTEEEEKSDYLHMGMDSVLAKPLLREKAIEILNLFVWEQKK